ncbi:unnamed protein product [Phytophthora lilii]|uniref:Unnamed protein product n=1 Tax=Phytophthora lilii TaxID=2077276 RepID=A0A9W6U045_9STRA|nr:unnamed protein product [Phytophthora lilii]
MQQLETRAKLAAMTPRDHLQLLAHSLRTKNTLQELLQDQKLVVAGVQSEIMDFQYILARSQCLNLQVHHTSKNRYEDADGNFCCERFEVNQLRGVKSVTAVYQAAKFFLTNVEITTTEALGHVTVREDYDTIGDDESIGSFRLISARPTGIITESHKVLYDKYYKHHDLLGGRPCAVMATDSVDEDELHPYDPKSRVRLDVSATLVITQVRRYKREDDKQDYRNHGVKVEFAQSSGDEAVTSAEDEAGANDDDDMYMVLIRCANFVKVRHPEIDAPPHALSAIADGTASWIKVMLKTIREFVDAL